MPGRGVGGDERVARPADVGRRDNDRERIPAVRHELDAVEIERAEAPTLQRRHGPPERSRGVLGPEPTLAEVERLPGRPPRPVRAGPAEGHCGPGVDERHVPQHRPRPVGPEVRFVAAGVGHVSEDHLLALAAAHRQELAVGAEAQGHDQPLRRSRQADGLPVGEGSQLHVAILGRDFLMGGDMLQDAHRQRLAVRAARQGLDRATGPDSAAADRAPLQGLAVEDGPVRQARAVVVFEPAVLAADDHVAAPRAHGQGVDPGRPAGVLRQVRGRGGGDQEGPSVARVPQPNRAVLRASHAHQAGVVQELRRLHLAGMALEDQERPRGLAQLPDPDRPVELVAARGQPRAVRREGQVRDRAPVPPTPFDGIVGAAGGKFEGQVARLPRSVAAEAVEQDPPPAADRPHAGHRDEPAALRIDLRGDRHGVDPAPATPHGGPDRRFEPRPAPVQLPDVDHLVPASGQQPRAVRREREGLDQVGVALGVHGQDRVDEVLGQPLGARCAARPAGRDDQRGGEPSQGRGRVGKVERRRPSRVDHGPAPVRCEGVGPPARGPCPPDSPQGQPPFQLTARPSSP